MGEGEGMKERFYFILAYLGCDFGDDDEADEDGNNDGGGGASRPANSTRNKRH